MATTSTWSKGLALLDEQLHKRSSEGAFFEKRKSWQLRFSKGLQQVWRCSPNGYLKQHLDASVNPSIVPSCVLLRESS